MAAKRGNREAAWPADRVERRPITELVPYARNARTHSDQQVDQIAASIREFGWTIPVLVDEEGTLIAGHGRILAAQKLGLDDVPVMVATGWSEAKKRAYRIADNRIPLNASWDMELLQLEVQDLAGDGFDLGLIGFDETELAQFFETAPEVIPPDDFPEKDETLETEHECPKCGYRWSGGKVTDRHGDEPE